MPSRPRAHQLESESKGHFAALLPSRWVFREANPDYGIDGQVELFDQNDKATGLMFLVQLKASEAPDVNDALGIQFKIDTLRYYRKLDLPVMVALYHSPTKTLYWKWAHELDTFHAARGQEYFTIRMSKDVVWDQKTPSLIQTDLSEFRELRAPNVPLPQTFSLVIYGNQFRGVPAAIVESNLIEAAAGVSNLVTFSRENPPGSHPNVVIDDAQIVVSLAGLTSLTFHTTTYSTEIVTAKLAHDILTAIALVFDRAGHSNVAAQIACQHLDKSTFLGTPEVFFAVLRAIAKGRRLTDGLRLAEALLQPEMLPLAQLLLVPALMSGGSSLAASEREYLRHLMKRVIEGFEACGEKKQAATGHYNLGHHLRAQGHLQQRGALRHYRLAAKSDPSYAQRHYYVREIGGVLFGLGRFGCSANAYEKALRLGAFSDCIPLRADALMFAGRYKEAHELFRKYLDSESGADAEWYLKSFALGEIARLTGLEKQRRDMSEATRLADVKMLNSDDAKRSLEKALRKDALCALAWFNLAITSHTQGEPDDALVSFLLAGLIARCDPDAWAHALLFSFVSKNYQCLVGAIAITAYRINGKLFMKSLDRIAKQQDPKFPANEIVDAVWQAVNSVERQRDNFEVRILGQGSSYQSLKFGPGLTPIALPEANNKPTETENESVPKTPT